MNLFMVVRKNHKHAPATMNVDDGSNSWSSINSILIFTSIMTMEFSRISFLFLYFRQSFQPTPRTFLRRMMMMMMANNVCNGEFMILHEPSLVNNLYSRCACVEMWMNGKETWFIPQMPFIIIMLMISWSTLLHSHNERLHNKRKFKLIESGWGTRGIILYIIQLNFET